MTQATGTPVTGRHGLVPSGMVEVRREGGASYVAELVGISPKPTPRGVPRYIVRPPSGRVVTVGEDALRRHQKL